MRYTGTTGRIPSGGIIKWSGAIVDIPAGFVICDGNNGTPDLRNNFVIGAGDTYNPADTGGTDSHVHSGDSGHHHDFYAGGDIQSGSGYSQSSTQGQDVGPTGSSGTLPPFYALAYIMKS